MQYGIQPYYYYLGINTSIKFNTILSSMGARGGLHESRSAKELPLGRTSIQGPLSRRGARKDHKGKASKGRLEERIRREGQPLCANDSALPPAKPPPNASTYIWHNGWNPNVYNSIQRRYWGRCTGNQDCTCHTAAERQGASTRPYRLTGSALNQLLG